MVIINIIHKDTLINTLIKDELSVVIINIIHKIH